MNRQDPTITDEYPLCRGSPRTVQDLRHQPKPTASFLLLEEEEEKEMTSLQQQHNNTTTP
jgi:hypothetical protein